MSTTLFIAPPGSRNKREAIFRELRARCPESDFSSVHYICPNSFVIGEAEQAFHRFLKQPAYIPFQTATLKNFALRFHTETPSTGFISERLRPIILCEVLGQSSIGHTRILSDLYKKLKHYLPDKELSEIKHEVVSLIFEEKTARRASEAIDALMSYEERLHERGLSDNEVIMDVSVDRIKKVADESIFVVDGFYDPTPLEIKLIRALIESSYTAFVLAEEQSGMARELKAGGHALNVTLLPASRSRMSSGYVVYPSMEEEVEGMARSIKGLILDGTAPGDIVVTFPVIGKYLPLLKRIFKKHGVPVSSAERDFSKSRPLIAIDDLITCIEDDYPAVDFLSFITSPVCVSLAGILKERAVSLAYRAGIVKGRDSWCAIKDTIRNSPADSLNESEEDMLDEFQKELNALITNIDNVKKQTHLSSFTVALEDLLKKAGFFHALTETEGHAAGVRLCDQLQGLFDEMKAFDTFYERDRVGRLSPGLFVRHMLSDIKVFNRRDGTVCIAPIESAAGLEAGAVFIGGVTEEAFPSKPPVDPLLPERAKKALSLPDLEYSLERQKRNFTRILNISIIDPVLSCPSADGDKVFIPSPCLDWESEFSPNVPNIFSEEDMMVMKAAKRTAGARPVDFRTGDFFAGRLPDERNLLCRASGEEYISVTHIDAYRKCPRRYYIERVLGLEIEKPAKFEVEARIWGTLAHKVMEYVFQDGDIDLRFMRERALEGLHIYLKQYPLADFWSKVAEEIFRGLLSSLCREEESIRTDGFVPYAVEEKIKADIGCLKLKGKIDRVDMKRPKPGGRDQGSGIAGSDDARRSTFDATTVRIIDYKTGLPDRDSLQLPLYAAMWQECYGQRVDKLGIYSLKEGNVTWYPKRKKMEEYIQEKLDQAEEIVKNMKRGYYPPDPQSTQECRYCYHGPICGGTT